MSQRIDIPIADIVPPAQSILRGQGVPLGFEPDSRILSLAEKARQVFTAHARPVGLISDISKSAFAEVLSGHGTNTGKTVLDSVYPKAARLVLFAVTIGEDICKEISDRFEAVDFAYGAMLDSAASEGASLAAAYIEKEVSVRMKRDGSLLPGHGTMQYSPGYCGWQLSAQQVLFGNLKPKVIGIELSDSWMMQPLKSVSGVVILGDKEIFEADDSHEFCAQCRHRNCFDRYKAVLEQ